MARQPSQPFRILIIAGEASGDLHGGGLVAAFKARHPDVMFQGVGGGHMRAAGVDILQDIDELGAIGAFELIGSLGRHLRILWDLRTRIRNGDYQAAILINYPAFNLLVSRVCQRHGCPVHFYIGPQVWASRPGRIDTLRRTVKKMYVVFPFEEEIYQEAGVPVAYLGHPFVDLVRARQPRQATLDRFGLDPGIPTIGLFPGSRRSEISYLLDDMLGAAALLRRELGRCQFLLPVADTLDPAPIRARAARASVDVKVIQGGNYEVMQVSDFLICASGSATLEAALFACPMVVIYRVNRLSQALLGWLVKIRYFGLVNIVAQEGVVTELLNDAVTPRRIADEALAILGDPGRGRAVRERLAEIRQSLGAPGVLQRIAGNMALEMGLSAQDEDETASF